MFSFIPFLYFLDNALMFLFIFLIVSIILNSNKFIILFEVYFVLYILLYVSGNICCLSLDQYFLIISIILGPSSVYNLY